MFCKNCGTKVEEEAVFCTNCGTRIEQNTAVSTTVNSVTNQVSYQVKGTTVNSHGNIGDTAVMSPVTVSGINPKTNLGVSKSKDKKKDSKNKKKKIIIVSVIVVLLMAAAVIGGFFVNKSIKAGNVKKNLDQGTKYLSDGKFGEAKDAYQKAIDLDKNNAQTYITIKDNYINKNRLDDACFFVKLAIDNNVDTTNMKKSFEDIKAMFEVTNIEETAMQNEPYMLPDEVKIVINNVESSLKVKWDNALVDTSKVGTFKFTGKAGEYERPVQLSLKVAAKISNIKDIQASVVQGDTFNLPDKIDAIMSDKSSSKVKVQWEPNKVDTSVVGIQTFFGTVDKYSKKIKLTLTVKVKETPAGKKIGIINQVYEENGKKYIKINEIEMYFGAQAIEEAKKDGKAEYDQDTGTYFVYNDYYTRDTSDELLTYELSDTASIKIITDYNTGIVASGVTYDKFKSVVAERTASNSKGGILCWITVDNNVISTVEQQYVP